MSVNGSERAIRVERRRQRALVNAIRRSVARYRFTGCVPAQLERFQFAGT